MVKYNKGYTLFFKNLSLLFFFFRFLYVLSFILLLQFTGYGMWVECFASIRFDVEEGPVVEHVVPPGALSKEARKKVLEAAFPDTNFECDYHFIYPFTMRNVLTRSNYEEEKSELSSSTPSDMHQRSCSLSTDTASLNGSSSVATRYPILYGCAYYRQKKDRALPRGSVQQLILLLSRLPYHTLHELILRVLVPRFLQCCPLSPDLTPAQCSSALAPVATHFFNLDTSFNRDHYSQEEILLRAMSEISHWPPPYPHMHYALTLLNQGLEFVTPTSHFLHSGYTPSNAIATSRGAGSPFSLHGGVLSSEGSDTHSPSLSKGGSGLTKRVLDFSGTSSYSHEYTVELPIFSLLHPHLHHLTRMWELLMCHQSIVVMSDTSACAAGLAYGISALIYPLRFTGKLYPHCTSRNEDVEWLRRLGKEIPLLERETVIVAGTNRMLFKAFDGWPCWVVQLDKSFRTRGVPSHPLSGMASPQPSIGGITEGAEEVRAPLRHMSPSRLPFGSRIVPLSSDGTRRLDPSAGEFGSPSCKTPELSRVHSLSISSGVVRGETLCSPSSPEKNHVAFEGRASKKYYIQSSSDSDRFEDEAVSQASHFSDPGRVPFETEVSSVMPGMVHTPPPARAPQHQHAGNFAKRFHAGFSPEDLQQVLESQVQPTLDYSTKGLESSRSAIQQKAVNYFDSSFPFVLAHSTLTELLIQQLKKASALDAVSKEVTMSMQLDQIYGSSDRPLGSQDESLKSSPSQDSPRKFKHTAEANKSALRDFSASTIFSQQSVADETIRRFFRSLTLEFLRPVEVWFNEALQHTHSMLEWCDGKRIRDVLTPKSFMDFITEHHRRLVGISIRGNLSFSVYGVIYDRFSQGKLFQEYINQLFDERLREEVRTFSADRWIRVFSTEEQRLPLFFAFLRVVMQEVEGFADPDRNFIEQAYRMLLNIAKTFPKNLCDELLEDLSTKWGIEE